MALMQPQDGFQISIYFVLGWNYDCSGLHKKVLTLVAAEGKSGVIEYLIFVKRSVCVYKVVLIMR